MKKVINGKVYNTETAVRLGDWSNGLFTNDLYYVSEDLYKTKAGAYFLYCDGGAGTSYTKTSINPLTYDEAAEWAEEKLDGEDYIKIFGEPAEAGDGKDRIALYLSLTSIAKLQKLKSETNQSISQIVDDLIQTI
jgi:hypothetical protein